MRKRTCAAGKPESRMEGKMLNTVIMKSLDNTITIVAPQRVRYMEDFVKYSELTCSINVDKQELSFGIYNSWEYEDGSMPDSESDVLTPHYSFKQFANSGLVDCIEQSYIWNSIFRDERFENPRTDAPMWMHEELHELTEFMHEVQNLLLLSELLPIEYTEEFHIAKHGFRKANWLYRQFEEVLNS